MQAEEIYELKSKVYGAEGRPLPPIVTHNLVDNAKVIVQIYITIAEYHYSQMINLLNKSPSLYNNRF